MHPDELKSRVQLPSKYLVPKHLMIRESLKSQIISQTILRPYKKAAQPKTIEVDPLKELKDL